MSNKDNSNINETGNNADGNENHAAQSKGLFESIFSGATKTSGRILRWNVKQVQKAYDFKKITHYDRTLEEMRQIKESVADLKNNHGETFDSFNDMVVKRNYSNAQLRKMYKQHTRVAHLLLVASLIVLVFAVWYFGRAIANGITFSSITALMSQIMFAVFCIFAGLFYHAYPALQIKERNLFSPRDFFKRGFGMIPSETELPENW